MPFVHKLNARTALSITLEQGRESSRQIKIKNKSKGIPKEKFSWKLLNWKNFIPFAARILF